MPGASNLTSRRRLQLLALVGIIGAVITLIGLTVNFYFDLGTTTSRVAAEQTAEQKVNLTKAPFIGVAQYDQETPRGFWYIVLDRELEPDEQHQLQALPVDNKFGDRAWELLRGLGGRLIYRPSAPSRVSPAILKEHPRSFVSGNATVFHLNLFSERSTPLSITRMRAINVSCQPSNAQVIVELPPQGGATYEGGMFDLSSHDPIPYVMDEASDQGDPYFKNRKIDLGGGMSPGGLRVEALVWEESCEWEIEATYHDSSPERGGTVLLRDGEKPFFAEARPVRPAQHWVADPYQEPAQLVPCHEASSIFCPHSP